jgi:hypothetical protein
MSWIDYLEGGNIKEELTKPITEAILKSKKGGNIKALAKPIENAILKEAKKGGKVAITRNNKANKKLKFSMYAPRKITDEQLENYLKKGEKVIKEKHSRGIISDRVMEALINDPEYYSNRIVNEVLKEDIPPKQVINDLKEKSRKHKIIKKFSTKVNKKYAIGKKVKPSKKAKKMLVGELKKIKKVDKKTMNKMMKIMKVMKSKPTETKNIELDKKMKKLLAKFEKK